MILNTMDLEFTVINIEGKSRTYIMDQKPNVMDIELVVMDCKTQHHEQRIQLHSLLM